ncbi:MAG TPA: histidine kinase [Coriobacteriia bacterium]|nr:histidine kinase [Coriobacteriia bacterium]
MKNIGKNIGLKTKITGLLGVVFLALLAVDIIWTYNSQQSATESVLVEESRMLVTEMDAVWAFVSINQDTINYSFDGTYEYKGLHCAIAGKSVAALFSRNSDYNIRFTMIEPRNIHNSPDEYENSALQAFLSNPDTLEYYSFSEQDGQSVFRYVSAMKVTEDCTGCHGKPAGEIDPTGYPKEGWNVGDLAGAVSVIVPTELYFSNMQNTIVNSVLFFFIIMLCMTMVIYLVLTRLITAPLSRLRRTFARVSDGSLASKSGTLLDKGHPLYQSREINDLFSQFESMASSLASLYSNLESQVEERTDRLSEANEELERQRRHVEEINDRLKQENRYKSDFLAIVSHELRTPLTSILAFTELMEENVPRDNERAHKQLAEIDKNGQILLEMVDNVLETARIQAGSEQLNIELVDFHDVVGMVEASGQSLALKKSISLNTRVDADIPLIHSDWEKLRRILVNLVSNAIKFTDPGGHVDVTVSLGERGNTVEIVVQDDGIGIAADRQKLIFERFAQENMSTVRRYGGSGLGLSLVKDLAEMLGGSVRVASKPGVGSTFTVALPLERKVEL